MLQVANGHLMVVSKEKSKVGQLGDSRDFARKPHTAKPKEISPHGEDIQ
jgi:hypothetical protein